MPIIKDTAPLIYPKNNYAVVKYLDLTRFISLIQRQSLFFCRLDKLEDHFEGTTSQRNYEYRINHWKQIRSTGFFTVPMSDEDIDKKVREQYDFEKKRKSLFCVSCWNKKETESAALWKIYSDFNKGIMIRSTIDRLTQAFINTSEEVRISEINYLDYDNQIMADGNSFFPVIHKHEAYTYEDEVRIIYEKLPETGWEYDWTKEEVQDGVYININIMELIDEIILSPYSPSWFHKLTEDLCNKYNIVKTILKSKLSIR